MKTILTLAILTSLALGGAALAQPGGGGRGPGHGHGHGHGLLAALDADKDGKITLAEMKREATQKFSQLDADKNGRVAKEELKAHHEQMREQTRDKADKKQDGERGGAHECRGKGHGGMAGHFFAKMDGNNDGAVDAKELEGFVEQQFARMDKNGDKVLSGDELTPPRFEHGHGPHAPKQNGAAQGAAGSAASPQ